MFNNVDSMEKFLLQEHVFICGRWLTLDKWNDGTNFCKNATALMWVQFSNVPHSYWSKEGLSHIASSIGKPVMLDAVTAKIEPVRFARICISIGKATPKPDFIMVSVIDDDSGKVIKSKVDILYPLPRCSNCNRFGHLSCHEYGSDSSTGPSRPGKKQKQNLDLMVSCNEEPQGGNISIV